MAKRIATVMGVVFLLIGLAGFVAPGLLDAHLNATHNIIHLLSGAVSLWFGMKGTATSAAMFAFLFGLVYGGLGVAGFLFGQPGTPSVHGPADDRLLRVFPGYFEVGTSDHLIHITIAAVYLIGALMTRRRGPS